MKRQKIAALIIVLQVIFAGCQSKEQEQMSTAATPIPPTTLSCSEPKPQDLAACQRMEQEILGSTLRIEMQGVTYNGSYRHEITKGDISHGTIVGGRYLVTHNHFSMDLEGPSETSGDGYTGVTLRQMNGEKLLDAAPMSSFTIIYEDPQTLVLEFLDVNGNGLFETLGLPSAPALDWDQVPWEVGMELAQIDWDGLTTHVDWVKVEDFWTNIQVPIIVVDNYAMRGASGGGVFWNGFHIGNNWLHNIQEDPKTGQIAHKFTIAALNAPDLGSLGLDLVASQ